MKFAKKILILTLIFSLVSYSPSFLGSASAAGPTYETGDSDPGILVMKKKLYRLGYKKGIEFTNYFGYSTGLRVKDFQRDNGLSATGKADEKTLNKLNDVIDSNFRYGRKTELVREFKKDLDKLGFGSGMLLDKYYGSGTSKNVKKFQEYYDLSVTGNAGYLTIEKLDEILASPLQYKESHYEVLVMKKVLHRLGYKKGIEFTNYFGYSTGLRVKDFQRDNGLPVSGIADYKTLDKLDAVVTSKIKVGQKSTLVQDFKKDLDNVGFGDGMLLDKYFGSGTTKNVKAFQEYYGLKVTGSANYETLKKLDEVLATPLQEGVSSPDVLKMKEKLVYLGYTKGIELTNYFGWSTGKRVEDFQRDNNIPPSGMADERTLKVLDQRVAEKQEKDKEKEKTIIEYTQYNVTLNSALDTQMTKTPQTDKYRNAPAYISANKQYVELTEEGTIYATGNVNLRTTPDHTVNNNVAATVAPGTKIEILETVEGTKVGTSTKWYKIKYNDQTLYVHTSLATNATYATTKVNLYVRAEKSSTSHAYGLMNRGTRVLVLEKGSDFHRISYVTWRNPTREDVLEHLDPANTDQFEHLNLAGTAGISQAKLKEFLSGKGTLSGYEASFLQGAEANNVNEVYLVTHALHETGNGTSVLAKGVYVDQNGNPYRDSKGNLITDPSKLPSDAVKVYNFFGIAAYDSNPTNGGAKYAFQKGWTTVDKAIKGGAKWIAENYVHHSTYQQNTIYKMRWNPSNPGVHQYATDIGWAQKQTNRMKSLYAQIEDPTLRFDIPVYKK